MIRFGVSALALALVATAASAQADLLSNGMYLGANLGYSDGNTRDVSNAQASKKSLDGARGGLQLGYNWAIQDGLFWGLEGDLQLGSTKKSWKGKTPTNYDTYFTEDKVKHSLALKAKLGYAQDNWAIYGTAGAVWAKTENVLGCDLKNAPGALGCQATNDDYFKTSKKSTANGYTVGIGGEYLVSDRLSMKLEYNYIDLGKTTANLHDPNYPNMPARKFDTDYSLVSLGVNYRF